MRIREVSQRGTIWFKPTWSEGDRSAILRGLKNKDFGPGTSKLPLYLDEVQGTPPIVLFEGDRRPSIRLARGPSYSVDAVIQAAKEKKQPDLSPESRFARLKYGNSQAAYLFLQDFGPLLWNQGMLAVAGWVHLDDFWARQARFAAVSDLWRALRIGDAAIGKAWESIRVNFYAMSIPGEADLGRISEHPPLGPMAAKLMGREGLGAAMSQTMTRVAVPMPWEVASGALGVLSAFAQAEGRTDDHISHAQATDSDALTQRTLAIALVQHELTQHTRNAQTAWRIHDDGSGLRCLPFRSTNSLWAEIWEIFAAEAGTGLSWRYCRVCGKPFYPDKMKSECCTTAEQSLYSKRRYAAEMRKG